MEEILVTCFYDGSRWFRTLRMTIHDMVTIDWSSIDIEEMLAFPCDRTSLYKVNRGEVVLGEYSPELIVCAQLNADYYFIEGMRAPKRNCLIHTGVIASYDDGFGEVSRKRKKGLYLNLRDADLAEKIQRFLREYPSSFSGKGARYMLAVNGDQIILIDQEGHRETKEIK